MIFEISFKMMLVFCAVFMACAWLHGQPPRGLRIDKFLIKIATFSFIAAFVALIVAIMTFGVA